MEAKARQSFGEIDVERINLVDADGKVRLVLSNAERFPDPVIDGKTVTRSGTPAPGMLFYDETGECGGLVFSSSEQDGAYDAFRGLLFDGFKQDQVMGIWVDEDKSGRTVGIRLWEQPIGSHWGWVIEARAIETMEDGPEKQKAQRALPRSLKPTRPGRTT